MVIKIPQHHTFSQPFAEEISDHTGCSAPAWEISVPRKHDLAWSVVLSYLISTKYGVSEMDFIHDFKKRLKVLTGSNENSKFVNKSMRNFNPFRNRSSCFYDEALKTVVNDFRKHLDWHNLRSVPEKLSAVSKTMKCAILLITKDESAENYQIFPKKANKNRDWITIITSVFRNDNVPSNVITVYDFMISSGLASKMQIAALHYYLKETKLSKKEIKKLESVVSKHEDFLIPVLKSGYEDIILKLYESPYVISKLSEIGYEVDPRATDSEGFSILYYAVILNNPKILYKLYYYAADDCFQSEGSYRDPDTNVIENLRHIEKLLSSDLSKLEDPNCPKSQKLRLKFEELLRLNRFLIEVNTKIFKIKCKLNYYESTAESLFEANKRRDIVVALLDTYKDFFKFEMQGSLTLSPLDDFISYKDYYNVIDMATTVIFFDNLTSLKARLKLSENQFSEIESSFLFSTIYHIVFEGVNILETIKKSTPNLHFNLKTFYMFPLIKRIDNFNKINQFSQILHNTVIDKDSVVENIPESEITSILHSYPLFKDAIELGRLHNYIKISLNAKIMDIKSVLAIERVLQVIGEYITPEKEDDFSFKRLLSVCIPKEISQVLRRIRHELSHLKGHAFPSKIECEKNLSLFRSIQKEIHEIHRRFRLVINIIALDLSVYGLNLLERELQRIKDSLHLYTNTFIHPMFLHEDVFTYIRNFPTKLFQKFKSFCHDLLKITLQNLEIEINNKHFSANECDVQNIKRQIIYILWPIKWILDLLQKCQIQSVTPLLDIFRDLEDSNMNTPYELKEKVDIFISHCKNFLSNLKITRKRSRLNKLKPINNIEYFMKVLKGFVYLSNEEREAIREEIPDYIREQVLMKNKLIQSVEEDFSLELHEHSKEFELSYLSKKKILLLKEQYINKDSNVLNILKIQDPVAELEEAFSKNSIDKKKYDSLCETMHFSEKTRKKLCYVVAGQRKKVPANNLKNLFNRIQLLKKILIDDNGEISKLWVKIKREKSRILIDEKIVQCYLKDHQLQAAVETLLFDCMMLFESVKVSENPWIKSSKLYTGINLRNVISHGSPLLESLCHLLDPKDLPSEIVRIMLLLVKGEDAVRASLELYKKVDCHYTKFHEVMNCEDADEYCDLRGQIKKCDEWKNYAVLLSYKPSVAKNTQ